MANFIWSIDATIVIALITLLGTIYTAKTNSIVTTNKQLLEMLEESQQEIKELKKQYMLEAERAERLERKILILTKENINLQTEVAKLNSYIEEKLSMQA